MSELRTFLSRVGISFLVPAAMQAPCLPHCLVPPPGLVAWWPGDGGANDIAGNHHGTPQNGATFHEGFVTSGNGQAFALDFVSRISVSNTSSLAGSNGLTIDAWIRATSAHALDDFGIAGGSDKGT